MSVGVFFNPCVRESIVGTFGSQAKFAAAVGVTPGTLVSWLKPGAEVSGQAIATVLSRLPLSFEQACRVGEFDGFMFHDVPLAVDVVDVDAPVSAGACA